jgi:ribose transport system substrate-binding protein
MASSNEFAKRGFIAASLLTCMFLAACGSDDSGSSGGGGESLGAAESEQEKLFKGEGYEEPASEGPEPQPGKKVWIFSCSESIASCSTPAAAAVEAVEAIGWEATLFDTRLEPSRITEGYRAAIAAGADGVVEYSLDCSISKTGLLAAEQANMPVVAAEALNDCGGSPQFSHIVEYTQGDYEKWWGLFGEAQATNTIVGTEGEAKSIAVLQTDFPAMRVTLAGFEKRLGECSGCEVLDTVEFTVADIGTPLQQKVQQALVEHPDANSVFLVYDLLSLGVDAAIRASGRSQEIFVAVAEGQSSTMDRLRTDTLKGAGVGIPQAWESYASVDALNRIFNGEEPLNSNIGLQAFDVDHNFPAEGRWEPPVDFKAAYLEAWGVQE